MNDRGMIGNRRKFLHVDELERCGGSRGWRRVGAIGRGRVSGGVGRIEGREGVRKCRRRVERSRDGSGGGRRWRK